MNQQQIDKIIDGLAALAEKLGTTSEYLFQVLVRQAIVGAIADAAFFTIAIVGLILSARLLHRALQGDGLYELDENQKAKRDYWNGRTMTDAGGFKAITLATAASASILGMIVYFPRGTIVRLLNPEYWAIQTIFDVFR